MPLGKVSVYYDKDGDMVECFYADYENGYYGEYKGNGLTILRERETDKVVGFTLDNVALLVWKTLAGKANE